MMTVHRLALLFLVLAGCHWSRENPYDPSACPDGCGAGSYCFEGRCVARDSGAADQPVADLTNRDLGSLDATTCAGAGQCVKPPGSCYRSNGVCTEAGLCHYRTKGLGSDCLPQDKCLMGGACDGKGKCVKTKQVDCKRPNTTGGVCVKGACQGFSCVKGWGNCNGSWKDGCERSLNTLADCGKCGAGCAKAANAKTGCVNGACVLSCVSPYKDCDKKYATGCEIPVGVANRCNKAGLAGATSSSVPCGTAHCGASSGADVMNFGTWYCKFCTHCHDFGGGWSWCLYSGTAKGEFDGNKICTTCCNAKNADKVCK